MRSVRLNEVNRGVIRRNAEAAWDKANPRPVYDTNDASLDKEITDYVFASPFYRAVLTHQEAMSNMDTVLSNCVDSTVQYSYKQAGKLGKAYGIIVLRKRIGYGSNQDNTYPIVFDSPMIVPDCLVMRHYQMEYPEVITGETKTPEFIHWSLNGLNANLVERITTRMNTVKHELDQWSSKQSANSSMWRRLLAECNSTAQLLKATNNVAMEFIPDDLKSAMHTNVTRAAAAQRIVDNTGFDAQEAARVALVAKLNTGS